MTAWDHGVELCSKEAPPTIGDYWRYDCRGCEIAVHAAVLHGSFDDWDLIAMIMDEFSDSGWPGGMGIYCGLLDP